MTKGDGPLVRSFKERLTEPRNKLFDLETIYCRCGGVRYDDGTCTRCDRTDDFIWDKANKGLAL